MARTKQIWMDIEGDAALIEALGRVSRSVRSDAAVSALMDSARVLRDAARAIVPVRTGLLRDSIFAGHGRPGADPRGVSVLAGVSPKAPHRTLVEYGTVHMAARPFWRPTVSRLWPAERQRLMDRLTSIIVAAGQ